MGSSPAPRTAPTSTPRDAAPWPSRGCTSSSASAARWWTGPWRSRSMNPAPRPIHSRSASGTPGAAGEPGDLLGNGGGGEDVGVVGLAGEGDHGRVGEDAGQAVRGLDQPGGSELAGQQRDRNLEGAERPEVPAQIGEVVVEGADL